MCMYLSGSGRYRYIPPPSTGVAYAELRPGSKYVCTYIHTTLQRRYYIWRRVLVASFVAPSKFEVVSRPRQREASRPEKRER